MSDSELGEIFGAMREASRIKRANNQMSSTQILVSKNISFESKNDGNHLIVTHGTKIVDFWPSTGKFISRVSNKNSRGIHNLLKYIGAL